MDNIRQVLRQLLSEFDELPESSINSTLPTAPFQSLGSAPPPSSPTAPPLSAIVHPSLLTSPSARSISEQRPSVFQTRAHSVQPPLQLLGSARPPSSPIAPALSAIVNPPLFSSLRRRSTSEHRPTGFQTRANSVQPPQGDQNPDAFNDEVSRLFAPYNNLENGTNSRRVFNPVARISEVREALPFTPSPRAGSSRGRPSAASSVLGGKWSKQIRLLGDPSETRVPDKDRKEELTAVYLRRGVLTSHKKASAAELMIDLDVTTASMEAERENKLFSSVNWSLMYAENSGTNQRLSHIYPEATPHVISALKITYLYARPDVILHPLSTETVVETAFVEDTEFEQEAVVAPEPSQGNDISSGFAYNVGSPDEFEQTMFGEIQTLRDLQNHMRFFNRDRQEIILKRLNGVIPVSDILELYTPSFNIYKEPYVTFLGEPGVDMEGLTREFFGTSQLCLMYTSYSHGRLFEGQPGHMLPSTNVAFLVENTFAVLGQFMLHSYFNVGYFFIGLSEVVSQFIMIDDVSFCFASLLIDDKDLPCEPSVHILNELHRIRNSQDPLAEEDQLKLRTLLANFSISKKVVKSHEENNVEEIIKLLKYSAVIAPRLEQLLQLRKSIRNNTIFHFLKFRQDLYKKAWKSMEDMNVSVFDIMNSFVNIDHHEFCEIKNFLASFLESKVNDGVSLRAFVLWISGLPVILERDWELRWQEKNRITQVSVCTKTMLVSREITQKDFNLQMELILTQPCEFTVV